MNITHIAIWTPNIEKLKRFYEKYFLARAGELYENHQKQFSSYFLRFDDECTLEIMTKPKLTGGEGKENLSRAGFAHMAFSVGNRTSVDNLTERLRRDGYRVVSDPRNTGDGYYESVVADPDGNIIEITT